MNNVTRRVIVENYNQEWPLWFKKISSFIKSILGSFVVRIEHIGSTSIPGMVAKPIIDFDVVIHHKNLEKVKELLANVGYEHEGDLGIKEREAFVLTNVDLKEGMPPHHLYVCDVNNEELHRHVAFREYLRTHPLDVRKYSAIKIQLVEENAGDLELYIKGKSDLVNEILERAKRWYLENKPS